MISRTKKLARLNIPKDLYNEMVAYYEKEYGGVIPASYSAEEFLKARLSSAEAQIKRVKSLKLTFDDCLDAGCGIGVFAALANVRGINFYGYDVDKEAVNIARKLFKANNINPDKISLGINKINKKFDLITSFEVIEHISDLNSYFKKLSRVISRNGSMFMEAPNYLIPYEPHYYSFLPPGPRILKWFFCRIKHARNKKFFDSINFVNKYSLESVLKNNGFVFDELGKTEWLNQMFQSTSPERSKFVLLISAFVKKYNLKLLIRLLTNIGFYTPLVYLAQANNETEK